MVKDELYSDLLKGIEVSPCIRDALGIGLNSIFNSLGIRKKTCPAFRNSIIIRKWGPVTLKFKWNFTQSKSEQRFRMLI
jgi:hypothetical protein